MKKLIPICIAFLAIVGLLWRFPVSADNLDQSQTVGSVGIGFGDTGNGRDYMCQGFKMATYNQITAVSFYINSKDGSANVGYAVWIDNADSNSNPLGAVAVGIGGFTEITNASLVTGSLTKYTLSSPVTITIGSQYDMCFAPWNTTTHVWTASYNDWVNATTNPYPNGRRVHLDGSFSNPTAPDSGNDDIQFQVFGQNTAAASHPEVTIKGHVVFKDKVTLNRGYDWPIQSVDVMKYSKDIICSPPSTSTVDTQLALIKAAGANYVAVSGYYDNPACASDITMLNKWNTEARAVGLKLWWRMKDLSWEGDYSVTKATSTIVGGAHQTAMDNWITANTNLLKPGDILTPFAEVQNGGINGVSYCGGSGICQFANDTEFNTFIQTIYTDAQGRVPSGVTVGYWGYDGFIAAGLNNPDWQGQSFLSSTTITSTGPMSIDDYPSSYGTGGAGLADNFQAHLALFHSVLDGLAGKPVPIVLGEYGTIGATSTADQLYQINLELPMVLRDQETVGFNYWNLGPIDDNTGEGLVTNAYTAKPGYMALQKFYKR